MFWMRPPSAEGDGIATSIRSSPELYAAIAEAGRTTPYQLGRVDRALGLLGGRRRRPFASDSHAVSTWYANRAPLAASSGRHRTAAGGTIVGRCWQVLLRGFRDQLNRTALCSGDLAAWIAKSTSRAAKFLRPPA